MRGDPESSGSSLRKASCWRQHPAAIGLFCARFGLEAIGRLNASHISSAIENPVMDAPVMLSALVLAVVTTMLFGVVARLAARFGRDPALRLRAGRAETAGSGARRLQRTSLVVAEVALSIVPLVCGGWVMRSFLNLLHAPLGFNPDGVVTAKVPVQFRRYPGNGTEDGRFLRRRARSDTRPSRSRSQ